MNSIQRLDPTLNSLRKDKITLPDTTEPHHLSFAKWRGLGCWNKGILGWLEVTLKDWHRHHTAVFLGGGTAPRSGMCLSLYLGDPH